MSKTGFLICSNPFRLLRIFPHIQCDIQNTLLYIHFLPISLLDKKIETGYNGFTMINAYKNLLSVNVDVRVLLSSFKGIIGSQIPTKYAVDVIFCDDHIKTEELDSVVSSLSNKSPNYKTVFIKTNTGGISFDTKDNSQHNVEKEKKVYENVVLGGTFDRLHNGHKILLSTAALKCSKILSVGITDISMLKSKKLWELIEPCNTRINKVKGFLNDIDPTLEYNILPIYDMYGPTISDPTFEMIVLSEETLKGGELINDKRKSFGLKPLDIFSVKLIEEDNISDDVEERKVSSSNYRIKLLGTLIKPPKPNLNIPKTPYIIGLTGGISSGKSSIANYLTELGAYVINADPLAHALYEINQPAYQAIIDVFGSSILTIDNQINRKQLGQIVFNDKDKLNELNEIMWPLILKKIKAIIESKKEYDIIIIEAAVLINANWTTHCHEIWVSIIPPNEAVKRLQQRNNLNEEEAFSRINSQPSNCEYISHANVVFCSLWNYNFTCIQIKRAWESLVKRITEIQ